MNRALLSSACKTWATPEPVRSLSIGFATPRTLIDPCPGDSPVGSPISESNGLLATWGAENCAYCNPPYGRDLPPWIDKCVIEARKGTEVLLLVPGRTDTKWWQRAYLDCTNVCLITGRLTFLGAEDPAPFPSVVFYWGKRNVAFAKLFGAIGLIIKEIK